MKLDEQLFRAFLAKREIRDLTAREQEEWRHSGFLESDLFKVLPDPHDPDGPGSLEASIQYKKTDNAYMALYRSTPEEKRELIYPIAIARMYMTRGHFTKRSGWRCYQLIRTNAGAGVVTIGSRMYRLVPGSFFLLDCRPYHCFYADDPQGWDYSFIHYDGGGSGYLSSLLEDLPLFEDMAASRTSRIFDRIFSASREDPEDFGLLFHTWMTELFLSLYQEKDKGRSHREVPAWLAELEGYIAGHSEEQISVSALAAMAYLSSGRFAHLFKEFTGISPIEYQHRIRLRKAMDLLEDTGLPAGEIGKRVGYQNTAGFYVKFRQLTGMTPGEYRKRG